MWVGIGLGIALLLALLVYLDARRREWSDAFGSPGTWATFTFLVAIIAIPWYVSVRRETIRRGA